MGVLSCDRRGCQNIMCDRLNPTFGYICNDCFNELVSLGLNVNVHEFMNTRKPEINTCGLDPFTMYDHLFPMR